jgi:alpha-tubulin suppressor-like RCC1 family protein
MLSVMNNQVAPYTAWAWGYNIAGGLGDGTAVSKSSPVQVGALTDWSSVSADEHSLAVKTDGTLWAWGKGVYGQLGDGTTVNKSSPVQIGSLTNWSSVSGGEIHSLAVKTDGTAWAWGRDNKGQLGHGTTVDKSSPVQIGALTDWSSVSAGGNSHSVAVKTDGTAWAWGFGYAGMLGNGTAVNKSSPVQIGSLTNWSSVSAGSFHSLAIKTA